MCCGRCQLEHGSGVSLSNVDTTSASRVSLEPPTDFLVLARLEAGAVVRLRTFTPDCDVDGGGMPLVWLNEVQPDDSVAWLASLVSGGPETGELHERVARPALAAIALHKAAAADRALESFTAASRPEWLRGRTAFWLGSARGETGARLLARMVANDPSENVREKALSGLSVSTQPAALATLIEAARRDPSARVRGRALVWLARKAGRQAVAAMTDAIANDPDAAVRKKAVSALGRLPKDEGVPLLIHVARTSSRPEIRKEAMLWLGRSNDPRATAFFEEILRK